MPLLTEQEIFNYATKWLLYKGYTQWTDGDWQHSGYEVNAHALLCEFIESFSSGVAEVNIVSFAILSLSISIA